MKHISLIVGGALASLSLLAVAPAGAAQPSGLDLSASDQTPQLIFGRDVADDGAVLEQAQFLWGGRNYCFYDSGWRGPGYYWCGYAFRRGYGWGGPMGWNGWNWRHGGPAGYRGGGGRGFAGGHGGGFGGGHGVAPGGHGGAPGGHEGGGHGGPVGGREGGGGHGGGGHEGGGGGHGGGEHH